MRTGRSLTVFWGLLLLEGGTWSGGVYLPGLGGCTWSGRVPAWSEGGVPGLGGYLPGLGGCTCLVWGYLWGGTCLVPRGVPTWSRGGGMVYLPGPRGVPSLGGTCLVTGGCTWSGGRFLPGPRGVYLVWGGTCLVLGGVPGQGGYLPGPGGGVPAWSWGGAWSGTPLLLTEWQTGVKTLPWPKLRFGR